MVGCVRPGRQDPRRWPVSREVSKHACPFCRGTGLTPLTTVYRETLAVVRGIKREVTGAELSRTLAAKPTAVNNRLAVLERHGYLTSRVDGRRRLYRTTEGKS